MTARQPVHGSSVAFRIGGEWRGVLIMGPTGAGKSDLALRLIGRGARLIADDYSVVWASGPMVFASGPAAIVGKIEARGLGIVAAPSLHLAQIRLIVDCVDAAPERLPEAETRTIDGVSVPLLKLPSRHASTPDLVLAALATL